MGATVLWYRLLLAGIAVVWLIVLFLLQYRLTDALGRRENEALAHPDEVRDQDLGRQRARSSALECRHRETTRRA